MELLLSWHKNIFSNNLEKQISNSNSDGASGSVCSKALITDVVCGSGF